MRKPSWSCAVKLLIRLTVSSTVGSFSHVLIVSVNYRWNIPATIGVANVGILWNFVVPYCFQYSIPCHPYFINNKITIDDSFFRRWLRGRCYSWSRYRRSVFLVNWFSYCLFLRRFEEIREVPFGSHRLRIKR